MLTTATLNPARSTRTSRSEDKPYCSGQCRHSLLLMLLTLFAAGCAPGPESPRGFSLPIGSADAGKHTFVELDCIACHTVTGVELPEPNEIFEVSVKLGGQVASVKTYADLVTSIINPSHKFVTGYASDQIKSGDESKMPIYNDVMTVTQLINLVTFLEEHYEVMPYQPTPYANY